MKCDIYRGTTYQNSVRLSTTLQNHWFLGWVLNHWFIGCLDCWITGKEFQYRSTRIHIEWLIGSPPIIFPGMMGCCNHHPKHIQNYIWYINVHTRLDIPNANPNSCKSILCIMSKCIRGMQAQICIYMCAHTYIYICLQILNWLEVVLHVACAQLLPF